MNRFQWWCVLNPTTCSKYNGNAMTERYTRPLLPYIMCLNSVQESGFMSWVCNCVSFFLNPTKTSGVMYSFPGQYETQNTKIHSRAEQRSTPPVIQHSLTHSGGEGYVHRSFHPKSYITYACLIFSLHFVLSVSLLNSTPGQTHNWRNTFRGTKEEVKKRA